MTFTILGSSGVIGSQLYHELCDQGIDVYAPKRSANREEYKRDVLEYNHQHILYCIGLTADFRTNLYGTIEAHICLLSELLKKRNFLSLTYLSSTRVYSSAETTQEDKSLPVSPCKIDDFYNISKLMGESLCLNSDCNVRVVRISNVYGLDIRMNNFISLILKEALWNGDVCFQTSGDSSKDYVSIMDIVRWLPRIAVSGTQKIYNLASGGNTSNAEIAKWLQECGFKVGFKSDADTWSFLPIDVSRVSKEFGSAEHCLKHDFENILAFYENNYKEIDQK